MPTISNKRNKYKWQTNKPKSFDAMHKADGLYNSRAWRKVSKANLKENPLCVMCERQNIITQATVTDHILPVEQGGLIWDAVNHQSLCRSCHAVKSANDRKSIKK